MSHAKFFLSSKWHFTLYYLKVENHVLMPLQKMTHNYSVCPFSVNGNDTLILASLQSLVSDTKSM